MADLTTAQAALIDAMCPVVSASTLGGIGLGTRIRNLEVSGAGVGDDLELGESGTPGSLTLYPDTAASGSLVFDPQDNADDYAITVQNESFGQATTLKVPDPGAATAQFVMTDADYEVLFSPGGADRSFTLSGDVTFTGAFNPTFAIPSSSTWTFPSGGGTLATTSGAVSATTADTFEINSDGNGVTLSSAGQTSDHAYTFPDSSGEVTVNEATQTLSAKTLASPTISGGAVTLSAGTTVTGTWDDLGVVTTVDINGGSIDGATVGANSASTGAFTTLAVGGGYGSTGVSISAAGAIQANGAITTDGALTADSIVCTAGATFGGGYGSTGATISTAGVGQFNGAVTSDGAITGASFVVSATANGLTFTESTNNAVVKAADQSNQENTYTFGDADADKYVAYTAQSNGSIARSDLTEEALAAYPIRIDEIRNADDGLLPDGAAGNFELNLDGWDFGGRYLTGNPASGAAVTDRLMFEFRLPPEYVEAGDVKIVVKALETVGAATASTTVSAQVYEDSEDAAATPVAGNWDSADITEPAQVTRTYTLTATNLDPGDLLRVLLQVVTDDTGGAVGTVVQINHIEVQCDIKG